MKVLDPGHSYLLDDADASRPSQELLFIKKELSPKQPPEGGVLELVHSGTTTEEVLDVLIDRLTVLNERLPDNYTKSALTALSDAKVYLENRNQERDIRGVRGTNRA